MDDGWLRSFLALTTVSELPDKGGSIWVDILVILLLLFINGFFAAAEMAIVSANDNRIRKDAEDGNRSAQHLMRFIENPGNFLATIQVGVTFAGFLSSSFAGKTFATRLAYLFQPAGPSDFVINLSLILVTLITSYLSIVLGELVPKQIALADPERFALGIVGIVRFFDIVFKPFTWLINTSSALVLKLLRINPEDYKNVASEEEIRMLLDQGKKSGSIHSEESEMIVNVFEFNDKEVSEIMTHRTSVIALNVNASLAETVDVAVHEKYSRIPVYEGDIDDIVGILHIKDLLYYLAKDSKQHETFDLRVLLREPYWVPESKNIDQLFREMQREHVSLSVVIDEYGGTAGIVTIEDLLEEIVGNIQDEYDEEDYDIQQTTENNYVMSGLLSPEDINRVLPDAFFPEDEKADYDTIAGLIITLLGRIPENDEHPEINYRNMTFTVLRMDDKRIDRVQLTINKSLKDYEEEVREQEERDERERRDREAREREEGAENEENEEEFTKESSRSASDD